MDNFKLHRRIQTDKLDAYYTLISRYAKKSVEKFGEQDIYLSHNNDMEQYVRTYFKEGAHAMKQLLYQNGVKAEPVIYLKNVNDGSLDELKTSTLTFLRDQKNVIFRPKIFSLVCQRWDRGP